jgi:tripartite-type tricarboxylate transporter receptor subunit TctC
MPRARLVFIMLAAAIFGTAPDALAANWPERPLRLIVPFTAGSSSDTIARIVAAKMGDRLGQQIIVDNRVGGSTVIRTSLVARAAPDGYTLGLANTTTAAATVALNPSLPFDPVKDFAPIGMIGSIRAPKQPSSCESSFSRRRPAIFWFALAEAQSIIRITYRYPNP